MGLSSPVAFVDPRTIVLLSGVMGGLMAVVLFFVQRNYPPSVRGLSYWAGGTALLFMAGLTTETRGILPDLFGISFANLLIFSGVYLQYFGSQHFFGMKPRFWPRYGVIIAMQCSARYCASQPPGCFRRAPASWTTRRKT